MENDEINRCTSTQKVLSAHHDPGWNDPPQWVAAASQNSTGTPTRRLLNKRVAFPLASAQTTTKEMSSQMNLQPANMPPPLVSSVTLMTAPHKPIMPPSDTETDVDKKAVDIDKTQALSDTLKSFMVVIQECVTNKNKADEIKKRLDMMKLAWLEDKLNSTIHAKVLELSKALEEGNIEAADKIHIALMMQYSNLCSAWIPGIRHIILELKTSQEESSKKPVEDVESSLAVDESESNRTLEKN